MMGFSITTARKRQREFTMRFHGSRFNVQRLVVYGASGCKGEGTGTFAECGTVLRGTVNGEPHNRYSLFY